MRGSSKGSTNLTDEKSGTYVVYCHTNVVTGKRYVGWTSKSMNERWKKHVRDAWRGSRYFHRSIVKYGEDAWKHEILETCSSSVEAKQLEKKWIDVMISNDMTKGYNGTGGGDGSSHPSVETRQRMSEARRGRKDSVETRERKRSYALNRSLTHKEALRLSAKAAITPAIRRRHSEVHRKAIAQYALTGELIATFESVIEAARLTNGVHGCISATARGERSHHHGFVWRYLP